MNEKTRNAIKGMAVGFVGILAAANALSSEMGTWQLLLIGGVMLVYVAAPVWWDRLEASR